jgi:hypothetical protein
MQADQIEATLIHGLDKQYSREEAQHSLDLLADQLGFDAVRLDDSDTAWVKIGELDVGFGYLAHLNGLVAAVALPSAIAHDERLMVELLRANMSWQRTLGGSFGIHPITGTVMLRKLIPAGDTVGAAKQVQQLLDVAQAAHEEIDLFLDLPGDSPAELESSQLFIRV